MLFLIGIFIGFLMLLAFEKIPKDKFFIVYIVSTILTIGIVCLSYTNYINTVPSWINQYILQQFIKGTLATGLFVLVMFAGACSSKYAIVKKMLRYRTQLSITACILALSHIIVMLLQFIWSILKNLTHTSAYLIVATILSLVLLVIMIPLMVTSFQYFKKKVGKNWKKLQRFAYAFYALLYLHIIAFNLKSFSSMKIDLLIYTIVFGSYFVLRLDKFLKNKKNAVVTYRIVAGCVITILFISTYGILFVNAQNQQKEEEASQQEIELAMQSMQQSLQETASETENTQTESDQTDITSDDSDVVSTQESISDDTEDASTQLSGTSSNASSDTSSDTSNVAQAQKVQSSAGSSTDAGDIADTSNSQQETTTAAVNTQSATQSTQAATELELLKYKNGIFQGVGTGLKGNITVLVSLNQDLIVDIQVIKYSDDADYMTKAEGVISKILNSQSTDVDAISGATYSSKGIINAVKSAMSSAAN